MKVFRASILLICILCARTASAQMPVGEFTIDVEKSDNISKAIDASTKDENFIKRPIARNRLRATNMQPKVITIREVDDSVEVILNHEIVLRTKPGAKFIWRGFKGEPFEVTTTFENGVLTNTFSADDGAKQNSYRLREDGSLELRVKVSSPRLKHSLEYTQILRRK